MADRRRRKCADAGSDESGDEVVLKTQTDGSEAENSEYESVDEDELGEDEEDDVIIEKDASEEELKKLDDDEDRKNPQYIPKKGTFYEHDDRTMEELENKEKAIENTEDPIQDQKEVKHVWREDDKWTHDRFVDYDQSPKSKEELVATYGYDIRNEEGPPRARRRRRYGRGPEKYTRDWKDYDAYSKQPTPRGRGVFVGGRGAGRGRRHDITSEEDFPSLPHSNDIMSEHENGSDKKKVLHPHIAEERKKISYPQVAEERKPYQTQPKKEYRRSNVNNRSFPPPTAPSPGGKGEARANKIPPHQRENGEGREAKKTWTESVSTGGQKIKEVQVQMAPSIPLQVYLQKDMPDVTRELKTMTITPSHKEELYVNSTKRQLDNRRNVIPPRLQDALRGNKPVVQTDPNAVSKPKRYSSQRQRPVQDQVMYQQGYYEQNAGENSYQGSLYEAANTQPNPNVLPVTIGTAPQLPLVAPGNAPPAFVSPPFTTTPPTYPPEPYLGRPPAPRMSALVAPPHLIGPRGPIPGPPVAVAVAAHPVPGAPIPPVTGPHFLPAENLINFAAGAPAIVTGPPHPPPQFPAAAFQAFPPVSQPQPQEIYSNGTMYYNTQSQQYIPRINPVLQKRPKVAIPIIPPPDSHLSSAGPEYEYETHYSRSEEESQHNASVDTLSVAFEDESSYSSEHVGSMQPDSSRAYDYMAVEDYENTYDDSYEGTPPDSKNISYEYEDEKNGSREYEVERCGDNEESGIIESNTTATDSHQEVFVDACEEVHPEVTKPTDETSYSGSEDDGGELVDLRVVSVTDNEDRLMESHVNEHDNMESPVNENYSGSPINDENYTGSPVNDENYSESPLIENDDGLSHVNDENYSESPLIENDDGLSPVNENYDESPVNENDDESPIHEKDDEESPVHEKDEEESPVHEKDDEKSPVHEKDDEESPVHEKDDEESPVHEKDDDESPVHEKDDDESPVHEKDDEESPVHEKDDESPVHEKDDEESPVHEKDDDESPVHEKDDESPVHEKDDEESPVHEKDDEESPVHEKDDDESPVHEKDDDESPVYEKDDESPVHEKDDYKSPVHENDDDSPVNENYYDESPVNENDDRELHVHENYNREPPVSVIGLEGSKSLVNESNFSINENGASKADCTENVESVNT